MLSRVYWRVPLLNRAPPWAVALGAAVILIAAGIGQGLITGQATTEVKQAVTVGFSQTLSPTGTTANTITTKAADAGASTLTVESSLGFVVNDTIVIDKGSDTEFRKLTAVSAGLLTLAFPLFLQHGNGSVVAATTFSTTPGIVTENKSRFLSSLSLKQGETGRIHWALENTSNQRAVARLDVSGLPPGAALGAASLITTAIPSVVRQGPTTFLLELKENLVGAIPNMELNLVVADTTVPGFFPVEIKIQQIPN